jgi:hypothetical protein
MQIRALSQAEERSSNQASLLNPAEFIPQSRGSGPPDPHPSFSLAFTTPAAGHRPLSLRVPPHRRRSPLTTTAGHHRPRPQTSPPRDSRLGIWPSRTHASWPPAPLPTTGSGRRAPLPADRAFPGRVRLSACRSRPPRASRSTDPGRCAPPSQWIPAARA